MASRPIPTLWENLTLAVAIIALGVMAGFFWTYTFNINKALLLVDGEIYATMQSLFNVNVRHGMFFLFFFGAGLFPFVAVLTNLRHRNTVPFWLIVGATLVYGLGVIMFTHQVNLPLNAYTESWLPTQLPVDWSATRTQWNAANALRVVTSFSAFILCLIALVWRATPKRMNAQ